MDTQTNFLSKRSLDMCIRLEAVEGPRPKYFFLKKFVLGVSEYLENDTEEECSPDMEHE